MNALGPSAALDWTRRRAFRIGENRSLLGRRPRTQVSWYLGKEATSDSPGIVLGGVARSGTTLARVILDSHPDIACGPESQLFCCRFQEYGLSRKFYTSRRAIRKLERDSKSFPDFVARFLTAHAEREGAQYWAEKTPGNIQNVGWILDRFPNVTFVHIVRDGRAVVNSIRTWPRHLLIGGKLVPNETRRDVGDCIRSWLSAVEAGLEFSGHPRVLEVRYEDFVLDPEGTITPVLERLGLGWDQRMARPHEVPSTSRDPRMFPANLEATKPIDTKRIDSWRDELTAAEVRLIEQRGAHILERFGYEVQGQLSVRKGS